MRNLKYILVDIAVHLWKYAGGYPVLNDATKIYRTDKVSNFSLPTINMSRKLVFTIKVNKYFPLLLRKWGRIYFTMISLQKKITHHLVCRKYVFEIAML